MLPEPFGNRVYFVHAAICISVAPDLPDCGIALTPTNTETGTVPRVVIIGAGFGGLEAARALRKAPVTVTIVDRHNYHLFQPLLYQVATASLSPAEIAQPIRSILKYQANARVILGEVTAVDTEAREVRTRDGRSIRYDFLIVATGAMHSYFDHSAWETFAPGIKTIDDATRLRSKILLAFEHAELESDEEKRRALLTFVIVGGGPTGVEMAGAIAELAHNSVTRDFRDMSPRSARVILAEADSRLLPTFPPDLSEEARRALEKMGVEVRLGAMVSSITEDAATIGGEPIAARTVIWAAGVRASPAAAWLDAERDRAGRVVVNSDFSVQRVPDVFVIGDTAAWQAVDGKMLPGVAPVAKQAGTYVGKLIAARVAGRKPPKAFAYVDYGSLATIGRKNAVVDFGFLHVKGFSAWLLWSFAHIYYLIGFRNRFVVALSWAWSYVTYQRGARLITGDDV
jgi:NADH dehydrogenase